MAKSFFECTTDADRSLTGLFNFVWPTAAALWNLRWQVRGFLSETTAPTPEHLRQRFLAGSGIPGADLKPTCIDQTWEANQEELAKIVLTNAFAIYEHWADQILSAVGLPPGSGKKLQFPGPRGIDGTLAALTATESSAMKAAYYGALTADRRFSIAVLPNLTLSYRYFKEIRNAQSHQGGLASRAGELAYLAFTPVSGNAALGVRGVLEHFPVVEGKPVRISLRGVTGFCGILLRMMATIDAELSRTVGAEAYFLKRLANPGSNEPHSISQRTQRRDEQIVKRCKVCGFAKPADPGAIYSLLKQHRIISI